MRHGHGGIQVAVHVEFEPGDTDRRLGDAGHVLAAGQVQGREPTGVLTLDPDRSGQRAADGGHAPVVAQRLRLDIPLAAHERGGQRDLGRDPLALHDYGDWRAGLGTPSKTKPGAPLMRASSSKALQPPASVTSRAPRVYEATSAASVVASGTR